MVDKQGQKVGGRYSLIDRNMKTVESQQTHVITQLWKIPSMKHAKALLGQMESCDSDVLEIGGEEVDSRTSASAEQFTAKVETDYRVHLVEKTHYNDDSDYDTDDLIEDARNFVITGKSKLVDMADWASIDEKRRLSRQSRGEKRRTRKRGESTTSSLGSDGDGDGAGDEVDGGKLKSSAPFLPRRQCELQKGFPVRLLSLAGSRITPGVVRYLGPNDQVGVELRERLGDCDGSVGGVRHFNCPPGHGQFVPLSRIVMAWRV